MAVQYTTAQLDAIIAGLEAQLQLPAESRHGDKAVTHQTAERLRANIVYFQAQYDNATDAPATPVAKVRTFFCYGQKGFNIP